MAEAGRALAFDWKPALRCQAQQGKDANLHTGEARMDNHNYDLENDAQKPGASWVGLLAGMLISLLIGGL